MTNAGCRVRNAELRVLAVRGLEPPSTMSPWPYSEIGFVSHSRVFAGVLLATGYRLPIPGGRRPQLASFRTVGFRWTEPGYGLRDTDHRRRSRLKWVRFVTRHVRQAAPRPTGRRRTCLSSSSYPDCQMGLPSVVPTGRRRVRFVTLRALGVVVATGYRSPAGKMGSLCAR